MQQGNQTGKARSWRRIALVLLVAIVGVVLVALVLLKPEVERIFASLTVSDCQWTRTVRVWNDANANGVRDVGEAPLAGVRIVVDDVKNQLQRVGSGTSDANGDALLSVFIPGCPETAMQIHAETPVGFCLTTPDHMDEDSRQPTAFGLVAC